MELKSQQGTYEQETKQLNRSIARSNSSIVYCCTNLDNLSMIYKEMASGEWWKGPHVKLTDPSQ